VPAPANDNFASAIALSTTLPGSRVGDTTFDATQEASEDFQYGEDIQSVWYTFTPTSTGRYRFKLHNIVVNSTTGNGRAVIAVYSGSALGSLTLLVNFIIGLQGQALDHGSVVVPLTSGTTYRIQVSSPVFTSAPETANAHTIDFDLAWEAAGTGTAPANDDIADAQDLGTDPADGTTAGSSIFATVEAWELAASYPDPSVWYRFHAATTQTRTINVVRSNTSGDWYPYFEVYRIDTDPPTGFGDLTFVGWGGKTGSDNYFDVGTGDIPLVAGEDYLIYVGNWHFNGEWDDFDLVFGEIVVPAAPGNDNRDDVSSITEWNLAMSRWGTYLSFPQAREIDGTTTLATAEVGDPTIAGFAATRNVWYRVGWEEDIQVKVWIESAVDCVLAIYEQTGGFPTGVGALVAEDDDSGPGNQPEITFNASFIKDYWIIVDSKTEGDFTLKFQRVTTGTPPANDDFAAAEVISSLPFTASGTTVDATAETAELDSEPLGVGPKDTVWYKYVADHDGQLLIKASCDSDNEDGYIAIDMWRGTSLDTLVRNPDPPPGLVSDQRGFFNFGATAQEIEENSLVCPIINGETYYFRVQTESGGSEDFTIYIDDQVVYLDLRPSGTDEMHGTLIDDAVVYLDLRHTGTELFHPALTTDSATVVLTMTPIATWETQGAETTDSATVRIAMTALGGECYSRFHFTGEGEADLRWGVVSDLVRWSPNDEVRWVAFVEQQPGCD